MLSLHSSHLCLMLFICKGRSRVVVLVSKLTLLCPFSCRLQPAELFTKQGAVGHIKEPVGTHGLMKVRFNKVIKQSDTVCLALYKRVYPKFLDEAQPQVVCR